MWSYNYTDLLKVFDNLSRSILLSFLEHSNNIVNVVKSYLKDRECPYSMGLTNLMNTSLKPEFFNNPIKNLFE